MSARARLLIALLMTVGPLSVVLVGEPATAAPAYSVTLTASTIRPDVGQSVRLTGRVRPAAPGKKVNVQTKTAGGAWFTIKKTTLTPGSTFKTTVRFNTAGRVAVRIVKPASRKSAQGVSRVRNLRVGDLLTPPVIKTSTLPHAVVGTPYSATVETVDDRPGLFAAIGLPAGFAIDSQTGTITGTATATGTTNFTVYFRDADLQTTSKALTLTVDPPTGPPVISTTTLPGGSVASPYTATLHTTGNRPGVWSVASGTLPAGLSLAPATGVISGTPTTAGTKSFTVLFTQTGGLTDTQALSIVIGAAGSPVISTTTLPPGYAGGAYSATLQTVGNKSGTWSVSSGALPAGLSLNAVTGVISGTPTTPATTSFTAKFTQTGGLSDTQPLVIKIDPNTAPTVVSTPLPNAKVGVAYTATLQTVGNRSGTWGVSGGSLPAGLTLNSATGVISGTPTVAGTAAFVVVFTALNGLQDSESFSIPVAPPTPVPPVIQTTSLPGGVQNAPYSTTLQADQTGTWSVSSGTLPAGLTLTGATGVISGTPTATGTSSFTVLFTATSGLTDTQALSITVV